MGRTFGACVLAVMLALQLVAGTEVYAAAASAPAVAAKAQPQLPKRPVMDKEKLAEGLSHSYGVSKGDAMSLLNQGYGYRELQTAFLYAELSKEPVEKVLELHKGATWGRVRMLLGMDAGTFAKRMQERQLSNLASDGVLKRRTVRKYTQQGYTLDDIRTAAKIAIDANKSLAEILPLRTVVKDWQQVRVDFGLEKPKADKKPYVRNQRSGAGFAGMRLQYDDKERRLQILSRDYLFTSDELSPLYDELGFVELENVCLHAYLGRVSLAQIMEMRQSYSWNRMKYVLGLTPQQYFDRCVDYQARRLNERMDMPVEVTKRFMNAGYAMHYINSAWLLHKECGVPVEKIIDMKTPYNTWNDVALQLGLTIADCQRVKDKISLEFGRHDLGK